MTEPLASRLPPAGQAAPAINWDPLVRISHWGLAAIVLANSALTKEGGSVHIALGWAGIGLLALRLAWGFVGPAPARFSSFAPNPMAGIRHLAGMMRGRVGHYPSHNPAGALMAYALWACLAVILGTGLAMTGATPMQQAEAEAAVATGDWTALVEEGEDAEAAGESPWREPLEEVHEVAANLILLLAFLHVAGVFVEQRLMRRNLVAPMLIRSRTPRR